MSGLGYKSFSIAGPVMPYGILSRRALRGEAGNRILLAFEYGYFL